MKSIGVGIIGSGGITLQNHLPGLRQCPRARVVALCDSNPRVLEKAGEASGVQNLTTQYAELLDRSDVQAVIIATPNISHASIALAAIAAGKHVLCEKPLAMNYAEAMQMYEAARRAKVRHMTAFTYRFVPAMRYLQHLVKAGAIGQPYHYRSCRLQDWGDRNLGWRQVKNLAGSGELGDMLSHRIDFAHLLLGRMERLVADTRRFVDKRQGAPSDLEDWVALIARFSSQATGVLESSKLATGRGESWRSQDYVEVNGTDGSLVFFTDRWNELQVGSKTSDRVQKVDVPRQFWKTTGSSRNLDEGDPLVTFRFDQAHEFIEAIEQGRDCVPSFLDGARAQAVMDAAHQSATSQQWVHLPNWD